MGINPTRPKIHAKMKGVKLSEELEETMDRLTYYDNGRWKLRINGGVYAGSPFVDRLAAYENTDLEPGEVMALKARALLGALESPEMEEYHGSALERADNLIEQYESLGPLEHIKELIQAEKEGRLAILPPNIPLTLEELRKMDGEPVYIHWIRPNWQMTNRWAFVHLKWKGCKTADGGAVFFDRYGEWWLAYRHKPKEGTS